MGDATPAQFFDLATRSSTWRLNCPTHGSVQMVIVFNDDIANRSYCQACFETGMVSISKKTTFATNGGPNPPAATTRP